MKINELMIGDWISADKVPAQINFINAYYGKICVEHGYNDFYDISLIKGLPITGDILKANGFVFKPKDTTHPFYLSIVPGYTIILYNSWDLNIAGTGPNSLFIQLHYVHELQHALRLVGLNELADNFKIK